MDNNHLALLAILTLFNASSLLAKTIQADRPGFGTGTYTVNPKTYYIELGFQFDYNNKITRSNYFTAPLLNIRTGINTKTELNILLDGWSYDNDGKSSMSDILVGLKHSLIETNGYNISLLSYLVLPTKSRSNSTHFIPSLGVLWDYNLNNRVGIFGSFQLRPFLQERKNYYNFQTSIGLNLFFTPKLSSYIEYYNNKNFTSNQLSINAINVGITYIITEDIQLDSYVGVSNNSNYNNFWGVGFAIQF